MNPWKDWWRVSRLDEALRERAEEALGAPYAQAEQRTLERMEARKAKLKTLFGHPEFQEYLKLQDEMNSADVLVATDCSDPKCMALKRQIRNHRRTRRLFDTLVNANGAPVNGKAKKERR